jgi:hypothetical protein
MTNRDLLKEAIADAKAVKETAIANAKLALEETFNPYLRERLAAKLNEMEDDDYVAEEELEEVEEFTKENYLEEDDMMGATMEMEDSEMPAEEDMLDLEALLRELDGIEEDKTVNAAGYAEDEDNNDHGNLNEAEDDEAAKGEDDDADGVPDDLDDNVNIEDMSTEDLESFIKDVIADMVSAGELEAGHEGMEDEVEIEDEEGMETGEEEGMEAEEEEINIDELLAEVNDDELEELTAAQSGAGVSGDNEAIQAVAKALDKGIDWVKKNFNSAELKQALKNISSASASATSTGTKESLELSETVKTLKSELNEINLLNAKLLYTNKIFRNKSLTESQKVKVLTAFDKATSKKEAQLVYETLTESLKVSTTKAPIKESMGSASKTLGGATSKPIIEKDAFSRMRELAFGIKK